MEFDIPEVDTLLFLISSWSYNDDLIDEKKIITNLEDDFNILIQGTQMEVEEGEEEGTPVVITSGITKSILEPLKVKYSSFEDYITTFYNLFVVECKAQISRAKILEMENSEIFKIKNGNVDKQKFFTFDLMKSEKFENMNYSAGDLLVLSTDKVVPGKACSDLHVLAIVDRSFPGGICIKISLNLHNPRIASFIKSIKSDSNLYVSRICNLATNLREYQALMSLESLKIADLLLHPGEINNINLDKEKDFFNIPEKLDRRIKEFFDPSQYDALKASIRKKGVTLIQGPPGTGKSTTILGILSVLLNSISGPVRNNGEMELSHYQNTNKANKKAEQSKVNFKSHQPWIYDSDYNCWLDEPILDPLINELYHHNEFNEQSNDKNIFPNCFTTDKNVKLSKISDEDCSPPERVLVCAPSNVAIDEIVRKLTTLGLFNYDGEKVNPKFIRIGPNYHPSIQEHCLDYIISQKMQSNEVKEVEKLRQEILMGVKIICSTLSIAGSNTLLTLNQKFDTVIIDEAGQSVEVSSLIPLKYNCERLILVGDPKQLSATVFSRTAIKYNYDLSLFRRFQDAGQEVVILRTQYRMNPYLSKFISDTFYDGKLLDSQSIKNSSVTIFDKVARLKSKDRKKVSSSNAYDKCLENAAFQPFVFFDIESKENYDNNSCFNEHQANFVVELVSTLLKIYNNNVDELISKLAIISPYSTQVLKIKIGLRKVIEYNDICPIEVNTVDGFQGKEKEIIIFSTVRSKGSKTIGFLKDEKRVNVGLSRAKSSLIVVGDSKTLINDPNWEKLVKYAYREAIFYKVAGNIKEYLANLESKLEKNDQLIRITKDEDFVRAVYS